jgi:hypothetical protein
MFFSEIFGVTFSARLGVVVVFTEISDLYRWACICGMLDDATTSEAISGLSASSSACSPTMFSSGVLLAALKTTTPAPD